MLKDHGSLELAAIIHKLGQFPYKNSKQAKERLIKLKNKCTKESIKGSVSFIGQIFYLTHS